MLLGVVLFALLLCTSGYRYNDLVRTHWREERDGAWQAQPANACPKFGVDLKVIGALYSDGYSVFEGLLALITQSYFPASSAPSA